MRAHRVEITDTPPMSCLDCGKVVYPISLECPGPPKPSPAPADAAEPDPDEVRRALECPFDRTASEWVYIADAARAWLKLREQPAEPAITIAQVIAACGEFSELYVVNGGPGCGWAASTAKDGRPVLKVPRADTAEAAFAKLYPAAVQKLRDTRDAADQKLQQLGVKP